jgi:hypothetical protein
MMKRSFPPSLLIVVSVLVMGCSGVSQNDLADLENPNTLVKREAIARIMNRQGVSGSLVGDRLSRENKNKALVLMTKMLREGKESKEVELGLLSAMVKLGNSLDAEVLIVPLIEKLKDEDAEIRARAVNVLAKTKTTEAAGALLEQLGKVTEEEQFAIIWALGEIAAPEAIPVLNRLLVADNKYVRYNARKALEKIKVPDYGEKRFDARRALGIVKWPIKLLDKYCKMMMATFRWIKGLTAG